MKKLIATLAVVASVTSASASEMALPNTYVRELAIRCLNPIFDCDYTTKTCLRGYATSDGRSVAGVLLDEDRVTPLRREMCQASTRLCIDYGAGTIAGRTWPDPDISVAEAAKYYNMTKTTPPCQAIDLDALGVPKADADAIRKAAGETP